MKINDFLWSKKKEPNKEKNAKGRQEACAFNLLFQFADDGWRFRVFKLSKIKLISNVTGFSDGTIQLFVLIKQLKEMKESQRRVSKRRPKQ